MLIKEFFEKSLGKWNSMRSGHSLAFQQFEEIRSKIEIKEIKANDKETLSAIENSSFSEKTFKNAFLISWEAKSDWDNDKENHLSIGSSILIPFPLTKSTGQILRSSGYLEKIKAISNYNILQNDTIILSTQYNQTVTEEKIWFISENVRCRATVIKSLNTSAIIQTSYSSEIRIVKT